jgi:hypothetical protein
MQNLGSTGSLSSGTASRGLLKGGEVRKKMAEPRMRRINLVTRCGERSKKFFKNLAKFRKLPTVLIDPPSPKGYGGQAATRGRNSKIICRESGNWENDFKMDEDITISYKPHKISRNSKVE